MKNESVPVPLRELRIFRKIIQREADVLFRSFKDSGGVVLADTTPNFIMREYLEMKRALGKLDGFLGGEKAVRK